MRATLRLLANVKSARFLEPFTPTGLTGLTTHPSPRPTLIYLYTTTLEKLKAFPESSVYRQSTEALTRHRLNIVESAKPPGFDAWLQRVKTAIAEDPERFKPALRSDGTYAAFQLEDKKAGRDVEDGEVVTPQQEGAYLNEAEMEARFQQVKTEAQKVADPKFHWEAEPALEAAQYVVTFESYRQGCGLSCGC